MNPSKEEIKKLIFEAELSQHQAAKLCHVSVSTFEKWCQGTTKMNYLSWNGLKHLLACSNATSGGE